jgi:tRNA A37 threonylcarbamoyladenosine synthetase subunit TsaC/SUA5/YrdC
VHVFNDFYNCPISIVDGDRCEYGVESTVIKIISEKEIHVFR